MPVLPLRRDPSLGSWPIRGLVGIMDLEFTAWPGSMQRDWSGADEWREIVQIGILIADAGDGFAVRDEFEVMVKPRNKPILSEYFVALTGITQDRLDAEGKSMAHVLPGLAQFGVAAELVLFNGRDGEILRENCAMHGLDSPLPEERMFNFRPLLARTLGRRPEELASSDLPALAGAPIEGRAHTALHDCRSIAAALSVWRRAGQL